MKVDMVLELADVPGSLIRALTPVSAHGGNIQSVIHNRSGQDMVRVQVSFLVSDESSLELMKRDLNKAKVSVRTITVEGVRYYSRERLAFVLVGHIIDKDLRGTIDRLNEFGAVSDVDVVMTDPKQESTVLINMKMEKRRKKAVEEEIEKICGEKGFLLIRSIT
jgi:ACT domain-containing protein